MKYEACADCGIEKTGRHREHARCKSCSNKAVKKGKALSLACRQKLSLAGGGDGDILNRRYSGLGRWTASVKRTFTCCVVCRSTENLEAHHIAPKATYPQYATLIFNGVTLCKPCHTEVHR